jgi:hypothetical protein
VHIHHDLGMAFVDAADLEAVHLPEGFGNCVQVSTVLVGCSFNTG